MWFTSRIPTNEMRLNVAMSALVVVGWTFTHVLAGGDAAEGPTSGAQDAIPNNLPQRNPGGIASSLESVVRFYETHLGFVFTDQQRADLVAFLNAL